MKLTFLQDAGKCIQSDLQQNRKIISLPDSNKNDNLKFYSQNEELASLPVGTEVSAKYKGAFCEAKVKKVNRIVVCKVSFKQVQVNC